MGKPKEKHTDTYYRLTIEILNAINSSATLVDAISKTLLLIKKSTGMEAVGIRLREGYDFPYYITEGFPASFVEAERSLCAYDNIGEIILDAEGKPHLECMCGNVICGRTDPSLPMFTNHGTFWTNGTTDLLNNTRQEDLQAQTRNRCNAAGYESVALIPLGTSAENIGLLQLNDHRNDMFTLDMIERMEEVASTIGVIYAMKAAETQMSRTSSLLTERTKKLNCLHEISRLLEPDKLSIDNVMNDMVNIMPSAWQFPEIASVRASVLGREYFSVPFMQGKWKLSNNILANEEVVGSLEVRYSENNGDATDPFMVEERLLLHNICESIGKTIERIQMSNIVENYYSKANTDHGFEPARLTRRVEGNDLLLKESHHRIKNSLSIIGALLALQAENIESKAAGVLLHESRGRVEAIAKIHEMLYMSKNFKHIEMAGYFRKLMDRILEGHLPAEADLELKMDIPDCQCEIPTMIACALILNELATNALKYALPKDAQGCLEICISKIDNNGLRLMVKDNGPGLPEGFSCEEAKTLGMKIIHSLAHQHDGHVHARNNSGAEFTVTIFPEAAYD